ncbi:acyltransferase [Brevibacterium aurantiacum]|uniref:Acyltransferase n=1 Tax=Brevibacterium aurantiacum TaxID=273384 RepID=A0A556C2V4_BREAU|nr:acyltransferase [Brevibacterium aurantiacum]TSI11732.1 acyltransferase [Brevibacterium aurantiacum]
MTDSSTTHPRPETARRDPSRLSSLDGLRGLAIVAVLLFHTGHLDGGFLGVDLFLVLSGFLITGLLLREITTTGSISLLRFWGRRLRRLFPALAAVLVGVALAVWWIERSAASTAVNAELVRTTLSDGLWVQLHLVNWHLLAQDASYWEAFGQSRLFTHLWSIAVEEQFYILWPVLLLVVVTVLTVALGTGARFDQATLGWAVIIVCAVLAALSQVLMVALLDPADPTRVYTGTDTRAFSLLLGAAAATKPARRLFNTMVHGLGRVAGPVMLLLAAGLLLSWGVVSGTDSPGLFTGGLFLHAAVSALLIGLCAAHHRTAHQHSAPHREVYHRSATVRRGVLRSVLESPPLRWLGRISYSLYLWHWPVIAFMEAGETALFGEWKHTVMIFLVSVTLAGVSTHLIEDPVRFRARWARGRTGAAVFALVSVGLLCLWLLLPAPAATQIDVSGF